MAKSVITMLRSIFYHLFHEVVGMFYPPFFRGGYWGQLQLAMVEGQGTPWMSHQLIAETLLMAENARQGANCTSGQILGFSILLKDTSTSSTVPPQGSRGFEPVTFRSQLYPLSYSRPTITLSNFLFFIDRYC